MCARSSSAGPAGRSGWAQAPPPGIWSLGVSSAVYRNQNEYLSYLHFWVFASKVEGRSVPECQ